jgi:hypothetical protein
MELEHFLLQKEQTVIKKKAKQAEEEEEHEHFLRIQK